MTISSIQAIQNFHYARLISSDKKSYFQKKIDEHLNSSYIIEAMMRLKSRQILTSANFEHIFNGFMQHIHPDGLAQELIDFTDIMQESTVADPDKTRMMGVIFGDTLAEATPFKTAFHMLLKANIPLQYKSQYCEVICSSPRPIEIADFLIHTHQHIDSKWLEKEDVLALCNGLQKGSYLLKFYLNALSQFYKDELFSNEMRYESVFEIVNSKAPQAIVDALNILKKNALLDHPDKVRYVLKAHSPKSLADVLCFIEKDGTFKDKLLMLMDGFGFNNSHLQNDQKGGLDQFYTYLAQTTKKSFDPFHLVKLLKCLINEELVTRPNDLQYYINLCKYNTSNTLNILRILHNKGFLMSAQKQERVERLFQVITSDEAYGNHSTEAILEAIHALNMLSPEDFESFFTTLLNHRHVNFLLKLVGKYKRLLPERFHWFFNKLLSVSNREEYEFLSHQGKVLNEVKDSGLFNPENENRIYACTGDELRWLSNRTRDGAPLFWRSQQLFNILMDSHYSVDKREQLFLLIRRFPTHGSVIIEHHGIAEHHEICDILVNRLPTHQVTAEFLNHILNIYSQNELTLAVRVQTIVDFLNHGFQQNNYQLQRTPQQNNINYSQSVHGKIMSGTAYYSAKRLRDLYKDKFKVAKGVTEVKRDLLEHTKNSAMLQLKKDASLRCLDNIKNQYFNYIDKKHSGLDINMLLLCCWEAVHDDKHRVQHVDLTTAKDALVEGLYRMQRSYNLNEQDIDDLQTDRTSCQEGAFILLVASLHTIHQSVEIKYITQEQASLKLPAVIKSSVSTYLKKQKERLDKQDFETLLSKLTTDGIEFIWQGIKVQVVHLMLNEFGGIYSNDPENPHFLALINTYIDVDMTQTLNECQTENQASPAQTFGIFAQNQSFMQQGCSSHQPAVSRTTRAREEAESVELLSKRSKP